ncbi:conserved phage C-terminal domain-containing protein [Streptococcus sp. sy004]|uniref:conserved phage C-terminal domain-containing protein n=1 Tax=Streptococcus sp. sy004 TaxID=2600149 RepID=UPI0011B41731|nr:conserved phage C-terminal domain-containing protein [Streptococcus sp. sy004]TWT12054.1 hypothetical protein FRX54_00530 [Streptococcus sp. sy004]
MTETFFKKEVEKYQYIQIPKWLFQEPYKNLSSNAKLMYAMLFNRLSLSLDNAWHDTKGQIFMYFTNGEFCKELGCSENTVTKTKKELKDAGLLHEERQGLTKPNRLYIKGPESGSEPQNLGGRTAKNKALYPQKVQTIKTDKNKTDINNNILFTCQEILAYLNKVASKNFQAKSRSHQKVIQARLKEGYSLDDFKKVVDVMTASWKGTDYEQYLQPQTLFGNKMDNYLNKPMPKKAQQVNDSIDERLGF